MNLDDYKRMASALFGECAGCDTCDACRARHLVEQVWESGVRSGRTASAARTKKCLITEWPWDDVAHRDLQDHALSKAPDGLFSHRAEAASFVREQLEAAHEWAGATKVVRKLDWALFMKGWLRRELAKIRPSAAPPQQGLFGQQSPEPSLPSRRDKERSEVFRQAVQQNSSQEPPPQWSTSAGTGSTVTLPASAVSSPTRRRSH